MFADALWLTGLFGGALGGALALPLFRYAKRRQERLLGLNLAAGAFVAAVIALRHSGAIGMPVDRWIEHLENVIGLTVSPLFVLWVRALLVSGPMTAPARLVLWLPLTVYAGFIIADGRPVPFIWILPAFFAATAAAAAAWFTARGEGTTSPQALKLAAGAIGFSFCVNLAQALRTFWPRVAAFDEIVPMTITGGFIVLGVSAMGHLVRTGLLRWEPQFPRYSRIAVRDDDAAAILTRLDALMRNEKSFTLTDLSLARAAALLEVTAHVLSESLNRVRGVPFLQYLAQLRVEEATRRLADPANDRFTIDAIAEACGFASRSAFYKTFRRIQGATPTEFRRQARAAR